MTHENNAAASVVGARSWREIAPDEWEAVFRTNVTGALLCARAAYPFMEARRFGRIITMGSIRSPLGSSGNVHYTTSKSALEGMGRVLARSNDDCIHGDPVSPHLTVTHRQVLDPIPAASSTERRTVPSIKRMSRSRATNTFPTFPTSGRLDGEIALVTGVPVATSAPPPPFASPPRVLRSPFTIILLLPGPTPKQ
jgi:NAD(P)-dependent dehydrogenase (short-subunit alcohol dehydrogenase family)